MEIRKENAMSWLNAALEETAEPPHPLSLEALGSNIDPQWIEEALAATGTATVRRRRLPAEQVIWLVIGMAMRRDRPIHDVASKLDLILPDARGCSPSMSSGAVAQARRRVGEEPVKWLFERTARAWAHDRACKDEWRGLSLYAVDGTTMHVPDSDENRAYFGSGKLGTRGESGYPSVRLTSLMAVRSHLLAAAHLSPFDESELAGAKQLWDSVPDNSLVIVDKLYHTAQVVLGIQRAGAGRHWLARVKKNARWTVLETLGRSDVLVKLQVSSEARKKDPSLPESYVARAICYEHSDSEGEQWLLTSLVDATKYPRDELVALYHERWEIELGYDEIKTHMLEREEAIRSRTVKGVKQELWGIMLAFNLVRLEMAKIADEAVLPPWRISFVAALRLIRDEWDWCAIGTPGTIPKKLRRLREEIKRFILPPRRTDRRNPREAKNQDEQVPQEAPQATSLQIANCRQRQAEQPSGGGFA